MAADLTDIRLSPFVDKVRTEILDAISRRPHGDGVKFSLKHVELEIQVAAVEASGVDGGFDLKVLKLGAKALDTDSTTHTVKLTLDVKSVRNGEPVDAELSR